MVATNVISGISAFTATKIAVSSCAKNLSGTALSVLFFVLILISALAALGLLLKSLLLLCGLLLLQGLHMQCR